jgi:hypothetical protein
MQLASTNFAKLDCNVHIAVAQFTRVVSVRESSTSRTFLARVSGENGF